MTRQELYERLKKGPVILDGATGSNLVKAGMPAGVCPELWILDHPDVMLSLQKAYVEAGTDILYAPTFSGNRIKLAEYGAQDRVGSINESLVKLARKAAGDKALVAGDLTMTGQALEPVGSLALEDLITVYKEQVEALLRGGADLFVVETMMSLAETRAAVIAIRECCDLPVIASLTFGDDGRTLYGTDPATAVVVLQSLGADVIGVNCSTGPEQMIPVIRKMKEYADVPVLAKPNAGLPILVDEKTVYPMEPEEFASYGPAMVEAGAGLIGGCCGTTPAHIAMLKNAVKDLEVLPPDNRHPCVVSSERAAQEIVPGGPFLVIGERINPTGKAKLAADLKAGSLAVTEELAASQEEAGAHILDVNLGTGGIDEKEMMCKAIDRLSMTTSLPLCIDTSSAQVMEAALRRYPGRALMNSISLEKEKIEKMLPLAAKYGAMFILLPLSDRGLPASLEEKKEIIREIMAKAEELGIDRKSIVVDGLVTTAGANPRAAVETIETIRYCSRDLGLATVVGLSNISFGLPHRPFVNGAFASMAISAGLTMAIANPDNQLLMGLSFASDLLLNKPGADTNYIERTAGMDTSAAVGTAARAGKGPESAGKETPVSPAYEAVLKGNRDEITGIVEDLIKQGKEPGEIINKMLIPAIDEVGRLFEEQKYFLPQLIASASAMEKGLSYLEPLLAAEGSRKDMPVIVIATVEGDIHDIGKNLVALMLRNNGYEVIDLGKDVPAREIIDAAKTHHASAIALSALMTTTMIRMKDTIKLRDEELPDVKVMIGGAVITQDYADEIHADGYSADAAGAVRLASRLLS
ncbi:MAG: homocysteine S-methyltransferase family protein [Eubacterium sp.]|nr:homocysteine S-methyltransferase family protein [Eubacterium sp.]